MGSAVAAAGDLEEFKRLYDGGERGHGARFPGLQPEQPVLDPQLHRNRARERPRGAHGADRRDVGGDQRRLARVQAASTAREMNREEFARFVEWVKERLARLRRLGLSHDAAQRRLSGSRGSAPRSSAPTTPPASSTSSTTCSCRRPSASAARLDYFQWTTILREVSALTAYHWVYRQSVKPWLVADLLILNRQMPRSLANCYEILVRHLDLIADAYGRRGPSQRLASNMQARLFRHHDRRRIFAPGTARVHRRLHRREQPARRGRSPSNIC